MRHPQRFLMTVFAFCLYCSLLAIDGRLFFPAQVAGASFFVALARFGFSSLVALLFLAVGSLAWFYARQRLVGWLFFGFCLAMMATFAVQTVAAPDVTNSLPLSLISHMGSALALALFSALLLVFPHHYFTREHDPKTRLLLRGYLVIVLCLCLLVCGYALVSYKLP